MRVSPRGDVFVVQLSEVEFRAPRLLEEAFRRIVERMRQDTLVVDMREVPSVTGLGMAVMVAAQGLAMVHRRNVMFAGVQPAVRRVLELVGADGPLTLHNTVEEAVRALGK
jgi:anti-anti-sigma factor